jgi:SAM-dependent methyltransferase
MVQGIPQLSFHVSQQKEWEVRYRMKGRQWGNAPSEIQNTPKGRVILELGVGDGKNLRTRQKEGILMVGLDFSLAALQLCRSDQNLTETMLLLGDVCYLPICDAAVHQVFAHHILGHIPICFCQVMLDEVYRVLRPGGLAAVTVFATGDMREGVGKEVEPSTFLRGDGIITRYFTAEDIIILSRRFILLDIRREEWSLLIRGKNKKRAVLIATLQKTHNSLIKSYMIRKNIQS